MPAFETFEHIVRHQSTRELVPFLLELEKKDVVAVRNKTRTLTKELEEHRQLGPVTWGRVGSDAQLAMLFLAAVATYTRKEAQSLSNGIGVGWGEGQELVVNQGCFFSVASHSRPGWFVEWFQRRSREGPWGLPDYAFLRQMEARELLDYEPSVFARTLAHSLHSRSYGPRHKEVVRNYRGVVLQEFADLFAFIQRDLLACFDYDTTIDSTSAYTGVSREHVTWQDIFIHLTDTAHLSRTELLTRSLLALRRDFRRPLLTWFKNVFLVLQPTAAERLERQAELVELLAHPLPLVINFALDQLKSLWTVQEFDPAPLLIYADGLITRQDLKTGIRTLLAGFEKLLKRHASLVPEIARLSSAALANADGAVQEKAAKVLVAVLGDKKTVWRDSEAEEVQAVIQQYADLLAPGVRSLLSPWLSPANTPAADTGVTGAYQPAPRFVPELSPATAVQPVQDWHELLFLTGQVVRHEEPLAVERWLDGLVRLQEHFPAGHAEQLHPYLVSILPFLQGKSGAQAEAILAGKHQMGHAGLAQAVLVSWAQGFTSARVEKVNTQETFHASDPLVKVEQQRYAAAEEHLANRTGLPLLSTPTHAPHWIAPSVLVQKLLAYEAQQAVPNAADLAVALARTAFTHADERQVAQNMLPQLQHEGLRELLQWFLTPEEIALPLKAGEKKSLVRQLTERLGKLLPSTAVVPASVDEALPWLWAIVARTKHPMGVFEGLEALTGSNYPGIVWPWQPEWAFEVKVNSYVEKWKPGKPVVTHRFTQLTFPSTYTTTKVPPSPLLLYSQYVRFAGMNHAGMALSFNYPFLASLAPNNPSPLHWHVLRTAGWADKLESTERDTIRQALRVMLEAGPVLEEPTTRLLACGLTHSTPECRALALEVLLASINQQQLLPAALGSALGQLLAAEFVPVQRLTDNLTQARAINAVTDDALRQVLGAVILKLPSEPLRNTRKLLETYADYAGRSQEPIPVLLKTKLQQWSGIGQLNKVLRTLCG